MATKLSFDDKDYYDIAGAWELLSAAAGLGPCPAEFDEFAGYERDGKGVWLVILGPKLEDTSVNKDAPANEEALKLKDADVLPVSSTPASTELGAWLTRREELLERLRRLQPHWCQLEGGDKAPVPVRGLPPTAWRYISWMPGWKPSVGVILSESAPAYLGLAGTVLLRVEDVENLLAEYREVEEEHKKEVEEEAGAEEPDTESGGAEEVAEPVAELGRVEGNQGADEERLAAPTVHVFRVRWRKLAAQRLDALRPPKGKLRSVEPLALWAALRDAFPGKYGREGKGAGDKGEPQRGDEVVVEGRDKAITWDDWRKFANLYQRNVEVGEVAGTG